jgi:hypothetical protein
MCEPSWTVQKINPELARAHILGAKPRVKPGVHPRIFFLYKMVGEPQVKPLGRDPKIWAQGLSLGLGPG